MPKKPPSKWLTPPSAVATPAKSISIAKGELDREARRILPRLVSPGTRLVPVPQTNRYAVRSGRSRGGTPRTRVDARIVHAFEREGLIASSGDEFVLTDIGHSRVTRDAATVDPFRAQHQLEGTRMIDGRGGGTKTVLTPMRVNLAETPLGWLRRRKGANGKALVSQAQFEAGEKLRADFTSAQMTQRVTADWSVQLDGNRRNASEGLNVSERALAARQRFYEALDAVGPGLAEPLVDVCCYLSGLEDAERRMGWPQRSGKVVLAIALERLADYYGFNGSTAGRKRSSYTWHAPDAPEMDQPPETKA
ncbi:MAG: DUF6456 domain-containing protein [Pseudomonadota bacterium]